MDTIANTIIQLKNANTAGKSAINIPYSKLNAAILGVLEREGYISSVAEKGKRLPKLEAVLSYDAKKPKIRGVRRVSRLSKRIYRTYRELRPEPRGGHIIVSTSKGILTDKDARKQRVGGEPLFAIW